MAVHMLMLCQTRHLGTQTSQRSSQDPNRPSSAIGRSIQPPLSPHRISGAQMHLLMAVAFVVQSTLDFSSNASISKKSEDETL
eukprot:scaffold5446_cov52-Cyclotella_meneghiniana.AAC.2